MPKRPWLEKMTLEEGRAEGKEYAKYTNIDINIVKEMESKS